MLLETDLFQEKTGNGCGETLKEGIGPKRDRPDSFFSGFISEIPGRLPFKSNNFQRSKWLTFLGMMRRCKNALILILTPILFSPLVMSEKPVSFNLLSRKLKLSGPGELKKRRGCLTVVRMLTTNDAAV